MGEKFFTIYLRTKNRKGVKKVLEKAAADGEMKFLVAPRLQGWIGVYPNAEGYNDSVMEQLAEEVGGQILSVYLWDSDVLGYSYYRDGQLIDEYCSAPDYLEDMSDEPMSAEEKQKLKGNAEKLADLLPRGATVEELDRILHPYPDGKGPAFGTAGYLKFAQFMKFPNINTSYDDFMENDVGFWIRTLLRVGSWFIPALKMLFVQGRSRFVHIPSLKAEKKRRKQMRSGVSAAMRDFKAQGKLLLHEAGWKGWFSSANIQLSLNGRGDGFFVSGLEADVNEVKECKSPWPAGGISTGIGADGLVESMAASPSGRLLALNVNGEEKYSTEIWKLDGKCKIAEGNLVGGNMQFDADERRLLGSSHDGVYLWDFENAESKPNRLRSIFANGALDPSGQFVLFCDDENGIELYDIRRKGKLIAWRLGKPIDISGEIGKIESAIEDFDAEEIDLQLERMGDEMKEVGFGVDKDEFVREAKKATVGLQEQLDSESWIDRMENAKSRGSITPHRLVFCKDGKLLAVATDKGVRVYEWGKFLVKMERRGLLDAKTAPLKPIRSWAPRALYRVNVPGYREEGQEEHFQYTAHFNVNDLAYDPKGNKLLYAGYGGEIGCMDLDTGEAKTLVEWPSHPAIFDLALSRDGSALACIANPEFFDNSTKKRPPELAVWNYPALLEECAFR